MVTGLGLGFVYLCCFGSYALAVWYGGTLIVAASETNAFTNQKIGAGDIIICLMATVMGAFTLGMAAPNVRSIGDACSAAVEYFETLERVTKMDYTNSTLKPDKEAIKGNIVFNDVCFTYPSKQNDPILDKINLTIEAGKKTAFVGESGQGKTTIVNLIERLYDIDSGSISIDGIELKSFDIEYLRTVIGYVAQEPVLFNTTIRDNILFGRDNTYTDDDIRNVIYF